jgi:hypothetical protein
LGTGFFSAAGAGFFFAGGTYLTGSGALTFFSGLSYLLGFTFWADSLSLANFYGFKSCKNFDIADSPNLPLNIPSTDRAASLTSL